MCITPQLSGLLVLAVGLWLRFDPETVELLTGNGAPDTFFIGTHSILFMCKNYLNPECSGCSQPDIFICNNGILFSDVRKEEANLPVKRCFAYGIKLFHLQFCTRPDLWSTVIC